MGSKLKGWHNPHRKNGERKHFRKKFVKHHPNLQLPNELEPDTLEGYHGESTEDSIYSDPSRF